jgi:hypothetical protein
MTFTPAGSFSLATFIAVVGAVVTATVAGDYVAHCRLGTPPRLAKRSTLVLALLLLLWLTATSAVVTTGVIAAAPMPRLPLFFAAANLAALLLALSPIGGRLARALPLQALVAFHAFRLPLELVLHSWAEHGTVPRTMTWTGRNFDIVTGVLAIVAAPFVNRATTRGRAVAWTFNVIGLALLLNVMRVAVMSSPLPFAWKDVDPPLQLALHVPYAWIVTVCVAGALAGHVVLTRALRYPPGGRFTNASRAATPLSLAP